MSNTENRTSQQEAEDCKQVKALYYRPGRAPETVSVGTSYQEVSDLLGGPVESTELHNIRCVVLSCEDSIERKLPVNRAVYPYGKADGHDPVIIFGSFLVLGEEWTGLPENADIRSSIGSLKDTSERLRTVLGTQKERDTQEDSLIEEAESLGRVYMKISNASLEDAEKTAEKDVFSEVLRAYWNSTLRSPKLCQEISEIALMVGEDFPMTRLTPELKEAFLRGCRSASETAIARLRKKKGISQSELSDFLGVSQPMLSKWESGSAIPRADKLLKISEVLDCSVAELLNEI